MTMMYDYEGQTTIVSYSYKTTPWLSIIQCSLANKHCNMDVMALCHSLTSCSDCHHRIAEKTFKAQPQTPSTEAAAQCTEEDSEDYIGCRAEYILWDRWCMTSMTEGESVKASSILKTDNSSSKTNKQANKQKITEDMYRSLSNR